jgi:hypothetical protein
MFSRAVRAEFNKAFSTRLWWLLLLILAGYAGLGAAGIAFSLTTALPGATSPMLMPSDDVSSVVYSMVTATGFVFPVIFGAMLRQEVRWSRRTQFRPPPVRHSQPG